VAAVSTDTGLARVVVVAPRRRLDVALPEQLPVLALLPTLLRHGGDDSTTDGAVAGGWVLRRADGSALDGARTLASQSVRDGELLHLVPRSLNWPEPDYDDVVEAIAAGAKQAGPGWTRAATRACGLAVTALTLLLIPVIVLLTGGPWLGPSIAALVLAVIVLAAGIALSRALADSVAGAVVGALALPNGFIGGLLLLGGTLALGEFGASQLLMGSIVMLVLAVIGYFGVADLRRVFVGGIVAGLGGAIGAALASTGIETVGAAAIMAAAFLIIGPIFPLLTVRLAKVPMPHVPRDAEDLRTNDAPPSLRQTIVQVRHSAELLTGALLGTAAVTVVATAMLAAAGTVTNLLLAGSVSGAYLLRSRALVATRQRVAPLVTGVLGMTATVLGVTVAAPPWARFGIVLPVLVLIAVLVCAAALVFSRRAPSPYLGRLADMFDVVLTLAVGPLAAAALGLFHVMRGLAG
jgi:type VII secretion integral membrane protein EccD